MNKQWQTRLDAALLRACRPGRNHRHLTVIGRAHAQIFTEHEHNPDRASVTMDDFWRRLGCLIAEGALWEGDSRDVVLLPTDAQRNRRASEEARIAEQDAQRRAERRYLARAAAALERRGYYDAHISSSCTGQLGLWLSAESGARLLAALGIDVDNAR